MLKYALACVIVLSLTACEGPTGPQGAQGPPGGSGQEVVIVDLQFEASEFEAVQGYKWADRSVPEITSEVVENGYVTAYKWHENRWEAMPVTIMLHGGEFFTSESYSYSVGTLRVAIQFYPADSEFDYDPLIRAVIVSR